MTADHKLEGHPVSLFKRWLTVLNGCNVPEVERADAVTRWLVISRACVFPMTFTSALIGVLLAAGEGAFEWWTALLCTLGLVAAHASNNLLNDWTDVRRGVDTEDHPRAQYSPHPILSGLTTPNGLLAASLALILLDAAIMTALAWVRGWPVLVFAVVGLALSLAYNGFLKRFALGELTALVVWGPLMIGGTYYALTGLLPKETWLATLPYGVVVASVLIGKHIDKRAADTAAGLRSVPVLLGERASLALSKATFALFYVLVIGLAAARVVGPWVLITALALPHLRQTWKAYSEPRPVNPPEGWTVWPLWYVGWAMLFNRRAGELFVLGLALNLLARQAAAALGIG